MQEQIDLKQIRFYLENAQTQLKNIYSKRGTNGKDSIQMCIDESLKELRKASPARPTQEAAVSAG